MGRTYTEEQGGAEAKGGGAGDLHDRGVGNGSASEYDPDDQEFPIRGAISTNRVGRSRSEKGSMANPTPRGNGRHVRPVAHGLRACSRSLHTRPSASFEPMLHRMNSLLAPLHRVFSVSPDLNVVSRSIAQEILNRLQADRTVKREGAIPPAAF
jgi:hypothetical protein